MPIPQNLPDDEAYAYVRALFGFELDELKTLYPTRGELDAFMLEADKFRGVLIEKADELGWDETKVPSLSDSQKKLLADIKKAESASISNPAVGAAFDQMRAGKPNLPSVLAALDDEDDESEDEESEDDE